MAIAPAALATEINTDPSALGYAAPLVAKNDQALADLINLPRAGGPFAANREPISSATFIENIDPTEFAALTQVQLLRLQVLLTGGTVDINGVRTQQNLLGIFPAAGATKANIQALLKRTGSRAEALFGRGTVVTAGDVSFALRGAK